MVQNGQYERIAQAFQAKRYEDVLRLSKPQLKSAKAGTPVLEMAGTAAVMLGRLEAARDIFRRLIKRHPERASYWSAVGYVSFGLGDFSDAAKGYATARELEPDVIEHLYFEGLSLTKSGDFEAGANRFKRLIDRKPDHSGALWGLANIRREQGRALEAMPLIQTALANTAAPDTATWMDYAETAIGVLDLPEVTRALSNLDIDRETDADALARAAQVLSRTGATEDARRAINRAMMLEPENPELLNDAAAVENDAGEFADAKNYYSKIIDSHPRVAKAYFGYSQLHTFSDGRDEDSVMIRRMEEALRSGADDLPFLHFALGKVYSDLGRFDEAFRHLKIANEMRRLERPYSREADLQRARFCQENFSSGSSLLKGALRPPKGSVSPIFVVGMPRSGTTLVEQMIGAHPDVTPLGELMLMPYLIADMYRDDYQPPSPDALADIGSVYRERVQYLANNNRMVIDKLPYNIFNVGEIAAGMPDAKIIIMRRDAGDVGLSCFATPFQKGLGFANDLSDIGFMIGLTETLSRHWRNVLPDRVTEFSYERLIEESEKQIRSLLDFCGLEWDENVLKFNEHRRRVGTASFVQVSKPLYRTSVAKWRHYVGHLAPLMNALNKC